MKHTIRYLLLGIITLVTMIVTAAILGLFIEYDSIILMIITAIMGLYVIKSRRKLFKWLDNKKNKK